MVDQESLYISSAESGIEGKQNNRGTGRRSQDSPIRISLAPFDYALLATLSLLVIPAFLLAHLPFRIDLLGFAGAYWMGTASHGAFVAILLMLFGLPFRQTLTSFFQRYRRQKARIILAVLLAIGLSWLLGFWLGLVVTVDALALAEFMERKKDAFEATLTEIFWPGLYLFCGILLVFALNHAIAGIRYLGTYDEAFRRLDWLIFRADVPSIARWSISHLPGWFLGLLQFSYFSLYPQIGGAIFLTVFLGDQPHAVQYVRAILVGYAIALVLFFVWPAKGPYFLWPLHPSGYSPSMTVISMQKALASKARMLWAHRLPPVVANVNMIDYYISFPCMHLSFAIITIWFLRRWKRIALIMLVFDTTLLTPAIILLEWHYVVDLFGGVVVAFLAIWISGRVSRRTDVSESGSEPQVRVPVMAP